MPALNSSCCSDIKARIFAFDFGAIESRLMEATGMISAGEPTEFAALQHTAET